MAGGGGSAGQGLSDLFDQPSRQEAPQRRAASVASPRTAQRVSPEPPRPAPARPVSDPEDDRPLTPTPGSIPDSPPPVIPRPMPPQQQQQARWAAAAAQPPYYYSPPGAIPVPWEARFESPGSPGAPQSRFGMRREGSTQPYGKEPARFGGGVMWEREEPGGSPGLDGPRAGEK